MSNNNIIIGNLKISNNNGDTIIKTGEYVTLNYVSYPKQATVLINNLTTNDTKYITTTATSVNMAPTTLLRYNGLSNNIIYMKFYITVNSTTADFAGVTYEYVIRAGSPISINEINKQGYLGGNYTSTGDEFANFNIVVSADTIGDITKDFVINANTTFNGVHVWTCHSTIVA